MSWILLEKEKPKLGQIVYLCTAGNSYKLVREGWLLEIEGELHFMGSNWFFPQPYNKYTHWKSKEEPKHVDLES